MCKTWGRIRMLIGIILMPIWIWIDIKIDIRIRTRIGIPKRCDLQHWYSVQAQRTNCAKDQFKSEHSNPLTDRSKGTFQHKNINTKKLSSFSGRLVITDPRTSHQRLKKSIFSIPNFPS
jgi:hypothetical protein